ncbi:hypothetical protein B296_00033370 [Ensete ventricosum]|uniref:Uncharacterized protein n=1 Tax=Ensete ventricosum TaxID=4639 RepID=A0A426YSU6_ENSVE|nr:hypothetical protein B296_00033370 [Ensete ventricosum]
MSDQLNRTLTYKEKEDGIVERSRLAETNDRNTDGSQGVFCETQCERILVYPAAEPTRTMALQRTIILPGGEARGRCGGRRLKNTDYDWVSTLKP